MCGCSLTDTIFFSIEDISETAVEAAIIDLTEDSRVWAIEGMCRGKMKLIDGRLLTSYKNCMSMYDVIKKFQIPDNWTYNDRLFWSIVVLPMLEKTKENDEKYFLSLVEAFFGFIAIANYNLSQKRPILTKEERKAGRKRKALTEYDIPPVPVKRVRAVGPVKFRSEKVPKLVTEETVRKYKVGAWSRRGHVRTYKSGKKVYVHSTVCHRKGFDEARAGQTVIQVKGSKTG